MAEKKEKQKEKYVSPCDSQKSQADKDAEKSVCPPDPCKIQPKKSTGFQGPSNSTRLKLPCPDSTEEHNKRAALKKESEELCCALKNPRPASADAKKKKK